MDCKKAQSLVTAYIMRKLNDKDLEDFLEHVDSCEAVSYTHLTLPTKA